MRSPLRAVIHELRWIVGISRPRSWIYLFGPFLLGIAGALRTLNFAQGSFSVRLQNISEAIAHLFQIIFVDFPHLIVTDPLAAFTTTLAMGLVFGYFLLPANLLIYGVNDLCDAEIDFLNPQKNLQKLTLPSNRRRRLLSWIIIFQLPWLWALIVYILFAVGHEIYVMLPLLPFLFFGIFYSAPPIRAKARPFFDSLFHSLYVMPGLLSYFFVLSLFTDVFVQLPLPWLPFLAGCCWFMAMHAYSAVPDIKIDLGANLQTIATKFGARLTLFACVGFYISATLLAFLAADTSALKLLIGTLGLIYVLMMCLALMEEKFTAISKHFSLVNTVAGACLCFGILLL